MPSISSAASKPKKRLSAFQAYGITSAWTTGLKAEAAVKGAMIAAARRVIVVAANQKFYHSQMFNFCDADKIDTIITTGPTLPESILEQIEQHHIKLIYADAEQPNPAEVSG